MTARSTSRAPQVGLSALSEVVLSKRASAMLESATGECMGSATWRGRKLAEARDLLALAEIAPRLHVASLDLCTELHTLVHLRVPVPCRPDAADSLVVAGQALLGIMYPQEAMWKSMPGYAFIQVIAPKSVWLPNVAGGEDQRICLGIQLPAGIRLRELVLGTYGALSMQSVQLDEFDRAGVLNFRAARWWQQNTDRIPLSRVPFLGDEDQEDLEGKWDAS